MNKRPVKVRYVSWNDIQEVLNALAKHIAESYIPSVIISIAKGGLIPARILADLLNVDEMGFIEVKFYKGIGIRGEKPFIRSIALPQLRDKNVLVVDDVADSGRTIQLVVDTISVYAPKSLKSSVLYVKPWSTFTPDYYYSITDEWLVFPWEVCEAVREGVTLLDSEFVDTSRYCRLS